MKTLEQIITAQKKVKKENGKRYLQGDFGLIACKESIKSQLEWDKKATLYTLLEEFVKRDNEDIFFNSRMVLACWELINGIE